MSQENTQLNNSVEVVTEGYDSASHVSDTNSCDSSPEVKLKKTQIFLVCKMKG